MELSALWQGGVHAVAGCELDRAVVSLSPVELPEPLPPLSIRRATPSDVPALQTVLDRYARLGLVLPRAPESLYRHFREYVVAIEGESVVACAGLRIYHQALAEVVGVAVVEARQGHGIGRQVVGAVLDEARSLSIRRVFALTLQVPFFEQLGFRAVPRSEVPEKIAADKAEGIGRALCRKITMIRDLDVTAIRDPDL